MFDVVTILNYLNQNTNSDNQNEVNYSQLFFQTVVPLVLLAGGAYYGIRRFGQKQHKTSLTDAIEVDATTEDFTLPTYERDSLADKIETDAKIKAKVAVVKPIYKID